MSLQMSIVFAALVTQMSFLLLLVTPLPFAIREKIVDFTFLLQKSPKWRTFQVFFVMLMVLQTVDCVNKLNRFKGGENPYYAQDNKQTLLYDQLALKFYAQRNLYISGAVLYLTVAIHTVVTIVRKLVAKEEAIRMVKSGKITSPTAADDASKLKQQLDKKEREVEALQKQVNGLQREYDLLTEKEERSKDD